MKRRNQLLALLLLLAFAGFGVVYFRYWVVQKPFGIVLFIGEGLSPSRIAAARVFNGGAVTPLTIDGMPNVALLVNDSADFATPDAAAAATAIATGVKTLNRHLGVAPSGESVANLVELARRAGRATGLVTDGRLTSETTAAFYAHMSETENRDELAQLLVQQAQFDVMLGGGATDFTSREKGGARSDGRDLLVEMRRAGIDVVRTHSEMETIPTWRRPRVAGLFADEDLAYADQLRARETQPTLSDMTRRAIELLQYNRGGYLLIVDAALMRKAAEENSGERTLSETVEFDHAIAVAQRYTGARALIVACGDRAIGGLTMNGTPLRQDRGLAVLGLNASGEPWLTWASGPRGVTAYGAARLTESPAHRQQDGDDAGPHPPDEPAAFYARAALPTVSDTVAFASGMGAEELRGTAGAAVIFRLISGKL